MDKTLYHKSKSRRCGGNFLLTLFCFLLNANSGYSQIRILFVGDILLSRNVKSEIQTRHTFPWEKLKKDFHSTDLVVGNLEGAVVDNQLSIVSSNTSPIFAIDNSYIKLLSDAGFNAITNQNNHSLDQGLIGRQNTIKALLKNKIRPVSLDNSPQFFTIRDTVIALVAINIVPGRDSLSDQLPSISIKQKLRLAKSLANIVIVSIHWGSELLAWPNKRQRESAQWLIKNGADIIIGSHPHVVQKPELIDGKPVFFSLGNHLFDQKYPETKEGLMVSICIHKGEFSCAGIVTHTQQNSFYPEVTKQIDFGFGSLKLYHTDFHINNYIIKPMSLNDSIGNKLVLQAFENHHLIWKSHAIPVVSIAAVRLDGQHDFLLMLEKHYSSMDKEINLRPYVYSVDNKGIYARWRGTALAWPVLDAIISPEDNKTLFVLHRGDSFIKIDKTTKIKRFAAYRWNGFGFTGVDDSKVYDRFVKLFDE